MDKESPQSISSKPYVVIFMPLPLKPTDLRYR